MSKRIRRIGAVVAALVVLLAVVWYRHASVVHELTVPPPANAAAGVEADVQTSVLGLRIGIVAKALEEIANTEIPASFDVPSETHRRRVRLGPFRVGSVSVHSRGSITRGPISISVVDGAIEAAVDVRASLTLYKGSLRETARGSARFKTRFELALGTDWQLVARPTITYAWIDRPNARLLGISVSLGSRADDALKPQLRDLEARIANELPQRVAVRTAVETAWRRLAEPLPLGDHGDLWLVAEPRRVFLPRPETTGGMFVLAPAIESVLRVVHGPRPDVREPPSLPALTVGAPPIDGIAINLPIDARYDALRAAALAALSKQPLAFDVPGAGKASVRIEDVKVYPSAPALVIGAKIVLDAPGAFFSTRGWVYLAGTPVYDAAARRLTIPNLDFSRDTDSAAVQVLTAAFRTTLRDALRRAADVDLSRDVAALREDAARRIAALPELVLDDAADATARRLLGTRLRAAGEITDIAIGPLTPGKDAVRVTARVKGRIALELVPDAARVAAAAK